ncbi:hypothetical protein DL95DRAFT_395976 [Leptodontidium sp. 2 PMI_412]|nr:hypothetical protein DL95DRAFT_395976 [Leptodontidium sp. 2 PMI_412]
MRKIFEGIMLGIWKPYWTISPVIEELSRSLGYNYSLDYQSINASVVRLSDLSTFPVLALPIDAGTKRHQRGCQHQPIGCSLSVFEKLFT